jgi:hypothetical protein
VVGGEAGLGRHARQPGIETVGPLMLIRRADHVARHVVA